MKNSGSGASVGNGSFIKRKNQGKRKLLGEYKKIIRSKSRMEKKTVKRGKGEK